MGGCSCEGLNRAGYNISKDEWLTEVMNESYSKFWPNSVLLEMLHQSEVTTLTYE